jgi:CheY-like chemotaxis protein
MNVQILLAEDNPGDILLVRQALEEHQVQHDLHVVKDGAEALKFIANIHDNNCPDVVLLDMNLPKIDGPEVLSELRNHPRCARTPVIVMSSSDSKQDRQRMEKLGVTRYFRKPTDLDAFLQLGKVVRELVDSLSHENI